MASPRNDPNRTCNRRVSFNLNKFHRKLFQVFHMEPNPVGAGSRTAHPSGWYADDSAEWGSNRPSREVDYLLSEILSKYSDGKTSEFLKKAAMERFYEAEENCKITNERLIHNMPHRFSFGATASSILYLASVKIANVLGEFCWDQAEAGMDWGPGATYSLPRVLADPLYKFQGDLETTYGNLALATTVLRRRPLWLEFLDENPLLIVPGNKIITVPKNAKTDRCIAVEPRMNMYVQKGIGAMIRKALRRVGVDLNDQSVNQSMARLGSTFENLATIDLSMASDTVSLELVRTLLPVDWVAALEQCRSTRGVLTSGESLIYQKFSSMGNGYTFELESLLFWGLASAVQAYLELKDRRVAVYGDDILFPSSATPALIEVFEYCGFCTNLKKTFYEGPFRESCGGHYFEGRDVSPFYIKRPVEDLFELFLLHNNLYRWFCNQCNSHSWNRSLARGLLRWIRNCAPVDWRRPRLPDGFGDGAFIGTFDQVRPTLKKSFRKRGFEGFTVRVLSSSSEEQECRSKFLLLKSLHMLEKSPRDFVRYLDAREESALLPSLEVGAKIVEILVPQFTLVDPFRNCA